MNRPTRPEDITEWIDQYLSNEMSHQEQKLFEAAILEDYALASQLDEQISARNLLTKIFREEHLRAEIRGFQLQERKQTLLRKIWKYSAAACVLIVTGSFFLLSTLPVFPDSENDFTVIRGADESVMRPDRKIVFDRFFAGQAHIAEGQYALAVKNFEMVLEEDDLRPYFREAAEWHLVVAYLKSGGLSQASELYDRFSNCSDCEYDVSRINRWKIWLQIQYSKALS
jgi:tetratricopeptide (TPR) repeat protein